jgi:hypothetical protein
LQLNRFEGGETGELRAVRRKRRQSEAGDDKGRNASGFSRQHLIIVRTFKSFKTKARPFFRFNATTLRLSRVCSQ